MTSKPSTVSMGKTLATLGGIVCIIGLVWTFDEGSKNILVEIGVPLASAVMFFAVSGGLRADSRMKGNAIFFLSFLNVAVLAFVMIYGTMDRYMGVVLILLALGVLISSASSRTARYLGADRA